MSESPQILRAPWPSVARQREGAAFGMWVFLASEVLFFGVLMLSYAVYHTLYPNAFYAASHETSILYGSINTALLLTSSLVMTLALHASKLQLRSETVVCLLLAAVLGVVFLAVKGLEYSDDLKKHLLPSAPGFSLHEPGARIFFALYWIMTAVHAVHLGIGIAVTLLLAFSIHWQRVVVNTPKAEPVALYWHFVDTIWIILYALIYLPGRP